MTLTVAFDAGHGGDNHGTSSGLPDFYEPGMTLEVAKMVKRDLDRDERFTVVMTRDGDDSLTLRERNAIAEKAGAQLVVSIHFNSSPDTERSGMECYYWHGNDRARRLCEKILENAPRQLRPGRTWDHVSAKSIGASAVLGEYSAPTVLVECAFLSSPTDREYLRRYESLQQIASSIVNAMPDAITIFGG